MCLYRVIKSDCVILSDVIYTVGAGADHKTIEGTTELAGIDTERAEENESWICQQKGQLIDEEAVWKRLQSMLEEERKNVLERAYKDATDVRMKAQQEGLNKGAAKRVSEIDALMCRIEDTLNGMEAEIESWLEKYEKSLTMLTADIASKVLNQKIEQDDMVIVDLIRQAIEEFRNSEWISVTLSSNMKESITEIEQMLKQDVVNGRLDVFTKDAPEGTCIIETPNGIVDASVGVQIENLKDVLKHIQAVEG